MKIRVFISMVLCVAGVLGASAADVYKFVIVEEETHAPMASVQVNVRAWCDGSEWAAPYDCVTDTNGICCVKKNNVRSLSVLVDGNASHYCSLLSGLGKAEFSPGLAVTVGVRRVGHPIPLVVKEQGHSFYDIFGEGNGVLQYDFLMGCYLPPAGTGVVADVTFKRMPIEELGFGSRIGNSSTPIMRHVR